MFIGEQNSGTVTEVESRDVTFIDNDFPKQGEIGQDLSLYETTDQTVSAAEVQMDLSGSHFNDNGYVPIFTDTPFVSNPIDIAGPSGSNLSIDKSICQSQPRRTSCPQIPHRRFEIEGEASIVTPDDEEPRNINETLTCPSKEKWLKAMDEEMESMKSNQCGNWLIYL